MASSAQIVAPQGSVGFRLRLAAVFALAALAPLAAVTAVGLSVFQRLVDAGAGQAELASAYYTFANTVLLLDLAMVFLAFAAGLALASSLTRPIVKLSASAWAIATGDLSQELDSAQGGQIGQLAGAVRAIQQGLRTKTEAVAELSRGNLSAEALMLSDADALGQAVRRMRESVAALCADVPMAAQAAAKGERPPDVDPSRHQGEFSRALLGASEVGGRMADSTRVVSTYLARIGRGEVP